MTTQTLGTTTQPAVAARVNLLPPEIAEKAAARRSQVAMVLTGVAAVGVVGALYMQASAKVSSAQEAKDAAVARNAQLRTDLANLQTVQDTILKVDSANATVKAAMQNEVLWSRYLHDMTLTIPDRVWLTKYTVNMTAAQTGNGTAVFDPGLGTITITGYAMTHDDVAAWLVSLAKERGYTNAFFTETKHEQLGKYKVDVERFTSQVNIGPKALSNRYAKGLER